MTDALKRHQQLTEQAAQLAESMGCAIHALTTSGHFDEAKRRKAALDWEIWAERADIADRLENSAES